VPKLDEWGDEAILIYETESSRAGRTFLLVQLGLGFSGVLLPPLKLMCSAFFLRIQPFGPDAPVFRILEAGRSPDAPVLRILEAGRSPDAEDAEEERVVICSNDDINALS
jgi:hypothetical protein